MIKNFDVNLILSSWDLEQEMSGLVLLKIVRMDPAHSGIPFLLTVEEVTKTQVMEAGAAGVSDLLVRPFQKDVFVKRVNGAIWGDEDPVISEGKQYYQEGMDLMKQGNFDEALACFKRIVSIQETAEAFYNMGYIKTAQGKYEEALIAFRKATQLNNAFAKAYQQMGEIYNKLGRFDEARHSLSRAAEIFMDKNMDSDAEKTFMKVLEINPNTPNVFNSLGIVYRRQGRHDDAIRMYKKAIRVNPYDEHIHYNLARVFISAKRFSEAADILRKATAINPDFKEAKNLLKSVEMGGGAR